MTSSPSRTAARRVAAFLTAFVMLLGLGALAPAGALADDLGPWTISGTVTDDTGAPAVGVAVEVSPFPGWGSYVTDESGHYAVPITVAGTYTVFFRPPAGSPLLAEAYDDAAPWNPTRITVGSVDITGVDAVLERAGSLSGRVVDTDGDPIAAVQVQLQSAAFQMAYVTTGADGTYTAADLRPGSWRVGFEPPAGSPFVAELYDDARTYETQTVVPLASGQAASLNDAVLARGNTISGRILAPDGTPRAGIEVYASTEAGGGRGGSTGADGTYAITGLADGDYTVSAQSDWADNLVGVAYPGTTRWQDAELVHVAGATTVQLDDLTLLAGATVTGTVYGPDGAPLANANVRAWSLDGENGATTGSDGSFSINLLPPGSYRVAASAFLAPIVRTFYAPTPGVTRPSLATPVVLAEGDSVGDIDIHPGAKGSATATIVATAAHPPVLGEPFTIDVTVTGSEGVPTGSLWVGTSFVGETSFADAELDADGHATVTFDAVDLGTYPWVDVNYVGDATYGSTATVVDYVPGAAAPAITSLAPATGTVLGGEQVTITGTGFGPDSTVTFGGVAATVAVEAPTTLVATAPAHAAGPVDVVVTTQGQASAPATYTYEKVATSLALTGPTGSTAAGAPAAFTATVTGAATPTGSVSFVVDGGEPVVVPLVDGSAVLSTSTLAAGAHTVTATFAGDDTHGPSSAQVGHTVTAPPAGTLPVVKSALPNVGLTTGGTLTVLTGKNFVAGRTTVSFGSVTTSKVTVLSGSLLAVVVPKHGAGAVRVTVTTPAGRSTTSASFTYLSPRGPSRS
ncbi:carboxypeptidase regulatory-like domain-containing protein [Cellulomonas terrae]|uniref:alpha-amylase n=1 Tax=Cellulomonas terrae TaxID=311234 RepID=A0A511JQS1_9CELL|nr:carboxypeptidase regulatory-like domain-containing protein [Cellulomonas terrae]GEM00381.1 hypothetical protein CTE05_39270 [Cellulomonas terrae]